MSVRCPLLLQLLVPALLGSFLGQPAHSQDTPAQQQQQQQHEAEAQAQALRLAGVSGGSLGGSTTLLLASALGCPQGVDLQSGLRFDGAPAEDAAPCFNRALSSASAAHPVLIVQDGASLSSGIVGPAAGHWGIVGLGLDTGFFQRAGSNADVIRDAPPNGVETNGGRPDHPGEAAPARGENVLLADLFLNGNRGDGRLGNATGGDPRGNWAQGFALFGINLRNLDHITIRNVRVFNTSTYNLMLSNTGDVVVDGSHFENFLPGQPVGPQNSDGVHIDGPANDIRISNSTFRTGDDAIALNAPEGYGGLITRVAVTNSTSLESQTMMRIYTGSSLPKPPSAQATVDTVTVTGYSGSANVAAILLGLEGHTTPPVRDTVTNVLWSDSVLSAPLGVLLQDNLGSLVFSNVRFDTGLCVAGPCSFLAGGSGNDEIGSLTLNNCSLLRHAATPGVGALLDAQSGAGMGGAGALHLGVLRVQGFRVEDATPTEVRSSQSEPADYGPYPALLRLGSGSRVGRLELEAVDPTHIRELAGSETLRRIGVVSGSGVLSTGWPLPESLVAPFTTFVDASTGQSNIRQGAGNEDSSRQR